MRMPDAPERSGMSKEKKQLLMLGGLSLALLAVMAVQFGEDGAAPEVAPSDAPVAAAATTTPGSESTEPVARTEPRSGNAVLSADPTGGGVNDTVLQSFWDTATPLEAKVEEAPQPNITLNATLLGAEDLPLAVIDGRLRRTGDSIAGWSISEIGVRQVSLRSPSDRIVTYSMPLLVLPPSLRPQGAPAHPTEKPESPESKTPSGDDA